MLGKRPLIRWNQLTTALRADPVLNITIREISQRNGLRARGARPAVIVPTAIAAQPDLVFSIVDAAVSRNLPRHIRDDVVGTVALMVLDGQISLSQVKAEARKQTSRLGLSPRH